MASLAVVRNLGVIHDLRVGNEREADVRRLVVLLPPAIWTMFKGIGLRRVNDGCAANNPCRARVATLRYNCP